jgi:hypothetical protein
MKPQLKKRRGALPPIIAVLIVVAAVVATALVAYFLYTTTARSVRAGMLSVVGQPTLYADGSLYVTLKNDGTAPVNMSGATIVVEDVSKKPVSFNYSSGPPTLNPGQSGSYVFKGDATKFNDIPDGALATLQTPDGYQLSFAVAKP